MKKKRLIIVVYVTVLVLGAITTALVLSLKALSIKKSGIICNGISVAGISLGGKTVPQAQKLLSNYIKKIQSKKVVVDITENGNKEGTEAISFKELEVNAQIDHVISEISNIGEKGNIIERYLEVKETEKNKPSYNIGFTYNEEKIDKFVENIAKKYKISPENATLTRVSGKFNVTGGRNGQTLNKKSAISETKKIVKSNIEGLPKTISDGLKVEYTLDTKKPKYDRDALLMVKDVLGTYSTRYKTVANRGRNIETGCKHINGSLLLPGETLSASGKMAPYTYQNGYVLGGAFANGKVVQDMGGGICQVSSTLYNAVLYAELEVVERQNHSLRVDYIPLSRDAAIAGNWKNLVFKNSSEYPIYVEGLFDKGVLTFNIYGHENRPANRKVDYKTVVLSSNNGIRAKLYKEVYLDGRLTQSFPINSSYYRLSNYEIEEAKKKAEEEKRKAEEEEEEEEEEEDEIKSKRKHKKSNKSEEKPSQKSKSRVKKDENKIKEEKNKPKKDKKAEPVEDEEGVG